ncbi:ATP-binding cassette domain-containing protein [Azoarcus indigens]|uniref:Manganese/zinc/iron transport system ATP-binding protein n=1 Tax=Azoarcus indigens TaxID=29545 RepID=A0A4R6E8T5_9RHOO|nr:ABC transporter ATP-binding protein [Azoarcus indigens]NMG65456.1 ATP-binding cassette domain-containing protein [Azoarcus indigens]TDN53428.1 manganese/zinc/iron transport system ATP- binding protein [Azoarcus indigens]
MVALLKFSPRRPPPPPLSRSPLAVQGLTVAYGGEPVLRGVDFVAPEAALVAVVGPNGAGKSTFLKAVLGLQPRLAGRISCYGYPVERQRRLIAYVPQRSSVDWDFPASALDVVAMGLYRRIGWCRPVGARHREQALACLAQVGMADFARRQIGQLSGGQQQRVFLARALAQDARLYLMDEPFAGVDAATERAIIEVLRSLRQRGRTVLCVHHDLHTAPDYFEHLLLLSGRVVAAGAMAEACTAAALEEAYGVRLPAGGAAVGRAG